MAARAKTNSRGDEQFMRRALALAKRGYGGTSPNPLVGAVIVRNGKIIGEGWHKRAGEPHAEVNAINSALRNSKDLSGATIYVTLEPCSTFGRTPPCADALIAHGFSEVVVAATDPNPKHSGSGFQRLKAEGINVRTGLLQEEANRLNEAFNHWITAKTPWVTCKCAMSLDGKIATKTGDSKWITSDQARNFGMRLRLGADAIIAGVNTVLRDDPALSLRPIGGLKIPPWKKLRRVILDPQARSPLSARVFHGEDSALTSVVVLDNAPLEKVRALEKRVQVIVAPVGIRNAGINTKWLLKELGRQGITSVLVEGGGETHDRFFQAALVNRVHFFYAPLVITGRSAPKAVAGAKTMRRPAKLKDVEWTRIGPDLLCSALVSS